MNYRHTDDKLTHLKYRASVQVMALNIDLRYEQKYNKCSYPAAIFTYVTGFEKTLRMGINAQLAQCAFLLSEVKNY